MPRYVILFHETPPHAPRASHWDFMLEWGEALRTWAIAATPTNGAAQAADALADHRLAYLTYEGPINGDRGSVTQWDVGEFDVVSSSADELRCELRGRRLCGSITLTRLQTASADAQRWMLLFKNK